MTALLTAPESEVAVPGSAGDGDLAVFAAPVAARAVPASTRLLLAELPAAGRYLADRGRRALATARESAAWLLAGARDAGAPVASWGRRARYRGRHHVERRPYGRGRSTAEQTAAYHRNYREGADLLEVDLPVPVYWIGWAARLIEVLRAEDEALHPRVRHRFICS